MSVLAVFKNQVMLAEAGTSLVVTSDPISMAGNNFVEPMTFIESLFNIGATAGRLILQGQCSNDGQNWTNSAINGVYTTTGSHIGGANETCAFIRIQYTYDSTAGAAGEITAVTFNCNVNLMHI